MPKAKCPTCGTVVTHAVGYDPICPNCGFRGTAPATAEGTAPSGFAPQSPGFTEPPSDGQAPGGAGNGLAIASLVCGVAGFLTGITAPVAVILGVIALNQRPDGAGRAMAITGIVLGALVTLAVILFMLFIAALFGSF
ncbi:MAG: DUF4190 domain-containing protein [Candidatus Thermoplasmatota archaeon]